MKDVFDKENIINGIVRYENTTGQSHNDLAKRIDISSSYFRRLMKGEGDFGPDKLYQLGLMGLDLNTLVMGYEDGPIHYTFEKRSTDLNVLLLIITDYFQELTKEEQEHVMGEILFLIANQLR